MVLVDQSKLLEFEREARRSGFLSSTENLKDIDNEVTKGNVRGY